MRHALTVTAVLALAAACASPGLPPGGPTISSFPRVIATSPDTNARNAMPGKVMLRYDDVIGEQFGGGPLSRAVLISPWDGEPRVEWKRTGMTIRPQGGWRPNTGYTITVLPGVADLKGQASKYGYVYRFSTGPSFPTGVVRGVAFDLVQARPLPNATIQALNLRDTTFFWLTVSDSTGRYELPGMPPGEYVMRAIDEKVPNRMLDSREPWDTARVHLVDTAQADLYVFVHDSMPPRIAELKLQDSVTIAITTDKPLLAGASIPRTAVRVVGADSAPESVVQVATAIEQRLEREREDSLARERDTTTRRAPPRRTIDPMARRDTAPTVALPKSARPQPSTELFITLAAPLRPGATYRVSLTGLKNLLGREGAATRLLIVPRPQATDTTGAPRGREARPPAPRPPR